MLTRQSPYKPLIVLMILSVFVSGGWISPEGFGWRPRAASAVTFTKHVISALFDDGANSDVYTVPVDFDKDGDVDQSDFGLLQRCFTGTAVPTIAPECQKADLNHDLRIDEFDTGKFLHCCTGAGLAGDPHCAD